MLSTLLFYVCLLDCFFFLSKKKLWYENLYKEQLVPPDQKINSVTSSKIGWKDKNWKGNKWFGVFAHFPSFIWTKSAAMSDKNEWECLRNQDVEWTLCYRGVVVRIEKLHFYDSERFFVRTLGLDTSLILWEIRRFSQLR